MSKISDFFYNGLDCAVAGKALDARQGVEVMQLFNQLGISLAELGDRVTDVEGAGGGIAGTSYLYVAGKSTATGNAAELQAAYYTAKSMTPYGASLSATNRVKIVVGSGTYSFTLNVDTQFIDIISLTGECDIKLTGINVSVNDVYLRGIDVGVDPFTLSSNSPLLVAVKCKGGDNSFGSNNYDFPISGTFIDCSAGVYSFGTNYYEANGSSGTFIRCTAQGYSFGRDIATGLFIDCKSGDNSFGGGAYRGDATGTFIRCTAGNDSFGRNIVSGVFDGCKAGNNSFKTASTDRNISGKFKGCIAGDGSFSSTHAGAITGEIIDCVGGVGSFNSIGSTGLLYNCRLTSGSYPTPDAGGLIRNCLDGNKAIINT